MRSGEQSLHNEEQQPADDQQPQPPPLMGGDGSHGPGVLVSTEQTRREENVDGETVTLQLQHPSSNDDNPILCSVVCNRRAIRASSSLIRNLLDNCEDDQELPPFSTEHIADELTLRRVVTFVTGVEPAIPEDGLKDDYFIHGCENSKPYRQPNPNDFPENLKQYFRNIVQRDGDRGGVLNILIAAHYLCCERMRNATAPHLAVLVSAWAFAGLLQDKTDAHFALFGKSNNFGVDLDPLANVPLPVLAEIAKLVSSDLIHARHVLKFSPALFKSLALVDLIWKDHANHNRDCDLSNPDCHICLAFEHRLEAHPDDESLCKVLLRHPEQLKTLHPRWAKLVESLVAILAKELVRRPATLTWEFLSAADLAQSASVVVAIIAEVAALDPTAMVHLPPLPAGGVDAIAGCWKDFYHFATHEASSISLEVVEYANKIDVEQLADVLLHNTKLTTLHIRQGLKDSHSTDTCTKRQFKSIIHRHPTVLANLLETANIQNMILDIPSDSHSVFLKAIPSSVKYLEVTSEFHLPKLLNEHFACMLQLEEVVLWCCRHRVEIDEFFTEANVKQFCVDRKRMLRVYVPCILIIKLDQHTVAKFRPEVEFTVYFDEEVKIAGGSRPLPLKGDAEMQTPGLLHHDHPFGIEK